MRTSVSPLEQLRCILRASINTLVGNDGLTQLYHDEQPVWEYGYTDSSRERGYAPVEQQFFFSTSLFNWQSFKAGVGIGRHETECDGASCKYNIDDEEMTAVEDSSEDPRFKDNPSDCSIWDSILRWSAAR